MTSSRILQLNAAFTIVGAIGMLAARGILPDLFGVDTPTLLDAIAVGLLGYAGLLVVVARRPPIRREAMMAFALADAAWVVGSAVVLVMFWGQMAAVARVLILVVALAVEVFAALQFRAARVRISAGVERDDLLAS